MMCALFDLQHKSLRLPNERDKILLHTLLYFSRIYLLVYCSHSREVQDRPQVRECKLNPYWSKQRNRQNLT